MATLNGESPESAFLEALIAAKKKFRPLVKNRTNPFYKSKYADLSDLHEAVDEALAENKLAVSQHIGLDDKERFGLTTKLSHVNGHKETSFWPLPGGVKPQELAAAITYGRRVSLSALLGIASEDDDDGNQAQEAHERREPSKVHELREPAKSSEQGSWRGPLNLVAPSEQAGKKYTKVVGAGGEQFAIMEGNEPMVKAAEKGIDKKCPVFIKYHRTAKGTQVVDTIEVQE